MVAKQTTVLVMAAGTGGHIFPALAIAEKLRQLGVGIEWLGTKQGMENELLATTGIKMHQISVTGLRGSGIVRKLMAPLMLLVALIQSIRVIRAVRPDCVVGMGGFVSGPGGIAAKLLGKPLLIHEQNAIAGATNKLLSLVADRICEAFPNTFKQNDRVLHTGNPLRENLVQLPTLAAGEAENNAPLRLLVMGGSQGAAVINTVIPQVLVQWQGADRPQIWHQTGSKALQATRASYQQLGLELSESCKVEAFINDMAAAYTWADLVLCRSGASTVSELAAVAMPSILVPYPYHSDQQQLRNASWLTENGAGLLLLQEHLSAATLLQQLVDLSADRDQLKRMRIAANRIAVRDASAVIANSCMELANA